MTHHSGSPGAGVFTSALTKPATLAGAVDIRACHDEKLASAPGRSRIFVTSAAVN